MRNQRHNILLHAIGLVALVLILWVQVLPSSLSRVMVKYADVLDCDTSQPNVNLVEENEREKERIPVQYSTLRCFDATVVRADFFVPSTFPHPAFAEMQSPPPDLG